MPDFSFGGLQSPFDNRDIKLAKVGVPEAVPEDYENEAIHRWGVWNQRKIGSCVGHAFAKAAQWYWYQKTGEVIEFSARFLYAIAKSKDGWPDEGTYPRLVAKILTEYGCATEATCPNDSFLSHEEYVYNRKIENIPQEAFIEAAKYKIPGYAFVPVDEYSIKQAISNFGFVSVLVRLGSEWWLPSWDKKDIVPLRRPKVIVSGHQIGLTGYSKDGFKTVLNHWSDKWADQGFNKFTWEEYSPYIAEAIVMLDVPANIVEEAKQTKYIFTRDMRYGDRSEDVRQLQKRLGVISTGYFGDLTRKAVIAFQDKYQIPITWAQRHLKSMAIVGPKTREKLNLL